MGEREGGREEKRRGGREGGREEEKRRGGREGGREGGGEKERREGGREGGRVMYLGKKGHLSNQVDSEDVVFLLSQVVLHHPILPITHQTQHLQGGEGEEEGKERGRRGREGGRDVSLQAHIHIHKESG